MGNSSMGRDTRQVSTYLRQLWTLGQGHRTQPSVCRAAETEPKRPSTWSMTRWTHSLHPRRQLYGRKEMFYLTTHSTHFIYGYMVSNIWSEEGRKYLYKDALNTFYLRLYGVRHMVRGKKEGNVLFNDTLNTFYLWLYGVGHMVKEGRKCFI